MSSVNRRHAALVALATLFASRAALAAPAQSDQGDQSVRGAESGELEGAPELPKIEEPFASKPGYLQIFTTVMGGTGLRFNNPYRLSSSLGSDAESVSRTNGYVDIGLAMTLGSPLGFQHGAALRTTVGVEGVGQVVMTPSYFVWRRKGALAAFGRAGLPLVLTPDFTLGAEAGVGGCFFFLGGVGVVAEMVGDLFYGTGTREVKTATYPVLSGQLGLIGTFEVLP